MAKKKATKTKEVQTVSLDQTGTLEYNQGIEAFRSVPFDKKTVFSVQNPHTEDKNARLAWYSGYLAARHSHMGI